MAGAADQDSELGYNLDWIFQRVQEHGSWRWQPVPERWPRTTGAGDFADAVQKLYAQFNRFVEVLAPCLDRQLGMSTAGWRSAAEGPQMSFKCYPPLADDLAPELRERIVGISAHTDFQSLFTCLHQSAPGLEVLPHSGTSWVEVENPVGCITVIGTEILETLCDGQVKALPHRVGKLTHERFAAQFFVNNVEPAMPLGDGTYGEAVGASHAAANQALEEARRDAKL